MTGHIITAVPLDIIARLVLVGQLFVLLGRIAEQTHRVAQTAPQGHIVQVPVEHPHQVVATVRLGNIVIPVQHNATSVLSDIIKMQVAKDNVTNAPMAQQPKIPDQQIPVNV